MPVNVPITREGLHRLQVRLAELKEQRSAIPMESQHAYDTGGYWHDNAGWEEAQRAQSAIGGEIAEIETVLGNHQSIERMKVDTKRVGVGTVVQIMLTNPDEEIDLTILGPFDTDPSRFIISDRAPLAEVLLGKPVGAKVQFMARSIKILSIRRWEPEAPKEVTGEPADRAAEASP